jgi:hypothetical protein
MALAACGAKGGSSPKPLFAEGARGLYSFSERIPTSRGQYVPLEGEFTVLGDTVTVRTSTSTCLYNLLTTRASAINYDCGDVSFAFDRFDPVHRATYRMKVRYTEQRQVCTQYASTGGTQRCVAYRTEFVETEAIRTGRLNARRGD